MQLYLEKYKDTGMLQGVPPLARQSESMSGTSLHTCNM